MGITFNSAMKSRSSRFLTRNAFAKKAVSFRIASLRFRRAVDSFKKLLASFNLVSAAVRSFLLPPIPCAFPTKYAQSSMRTNKIPVTIGNSIKNETAAPPIKYRTKPATNILVKSSPSVNTLYFRLLMRFTAYVHSYPQISNPPIRSDNRCSECLCDSYESEQRHRNTPRPSMRLNTSTQTSLFEPKPFDHPRGQELNSILESLDAHFQPPYIVAVVLGAQEARGHCGLDCETVPRCTVTKHLRGKTQRGRSFDQRDSLSADHFARANDLASPRKYTLQSAICPVFYSSISRNKFSSDVFCGDDNAVGVDVDELGWYPSFMSEMAQLISISADFITLSTLIFSDNASAKD